MDDVDAVSLDRFSLTAGGRTLLSGVSLRIRRGEFVLLVGASGSGKSVTLSFLTGLFRPGSGVSATGAVAVLGRDPASGPPPGVGVVFQDFALFDDWDALTNVRFAADHAAADSTASAAAPAELLGSFGLPLGAIPGRMSGGQKQRLAIARTLASRPRLVFYDEPTSGLDPALSASVAAELRRAHDRGGMTSVVVTHDVDALARVADRVLLLDPQALTLREIARERVDEALAALRGFRAPEPTLAPRPPFGRRFAAGGLALLEEIGAGTRALGEGLVRLVPRPPRARWGLRFAAFYARLTVIGAALPFFALAGLVSGFVVAFFLFELVPYAGFTEPVLLEEITAALGFVLFRVVAPGTTALLFAARAGAALAADFGRRRQSRQLDALRLTGAEPSRYLLGPALWAGLLGAPVLFCVVWKTAAFAAAVVFLATHPEHGSFSFTDRFTSLVGETRPWTRHTGFAVGKTLAAAFGTVVVAWRAGLRPATDGAGVARGVTRAVVRAILWVLLVQLVFAFVEFGPSAPPR
jgi:phospholipid/cholesterol/gamma-HCH transport system ATP-binding protein